jgi:predicted RecB family nuclease
MVNERVFDDAARALLLAVDGVGPKVVERLEQLDIHTLGQLAEQDARSICERMALLLGSPCWKNSPRARSAVAAAIAMARAHSPTTKT